MFKVGDKVKYAGKWNAVYEVRAVSDNQELVLLNGSDTWQPVAIFDLVKKSDTVSITHLRTICDQLRSVAAPQGRFWIREVFEKATGGKME